MSENIKLGYGFRLMVDDEPWSDQQWHYFAEMPENKWEKCPSGSGRSSCGVYRPRRVPIDAGPGFRLLEEDSGEMVLPCDFDITHDGVEWVGMCWAFHREKFSERMKRDPNILAIRVPIPAPEPAAPDYDSGTKYLCRVCNAPATEKRGELWFCDRHPAPAAPAWPKPVTDLSGLPGDNEAVLVWVGTFWQALNARVLRQDKLPDIYTHWQLQPDPPAERTQGEIDREAYKAWGRSQITSANLEQAYMAGLAEGRSGKGGQ